MSTVPDSIVYTESDLAPREVPVEIKGKKYVLREASGDAEIQYRNALMRGARLDRSGKTASLEGMADSIAVLISRCLYILDNLGRLRVDGQGNPDQRWLTPIPTIRAWPSRLQKQLFDVCKKISKLEEEEEEEYTLDTIKEKIKTDVDKLYALGGTIDDVCSILGMESRSEHEEFPPGNSAVESNGDNREVNPTVG